MLVEWLCHPSQLSVVPPLELLPVDFMLPAVHPEPETHYLLVSVPSKVRVSVLLHQPVL